MTIKDAYTNIERLLVRMAEASEREYDEAVLRSMRCEKKESCQSHTDHCDVIMAVDHTKMDVCNMVLERIYEERGRSYAAPKWIER